VIQRPARPPEDLAVHLAGAADGRRVDDGQVLLEMVDEHAIEEVLVAVLERAQPDIALEGVVLARDVAVGPRGLHLHRAHHVGEESVQAEGGPLLAGEGGALVVHRVAEKLRPAVGDADARSVLVRPDVVPLHGRMFPRGRRRCNPC
jgi:hypothetical protein